MLCHPGQPKGDPGPTRFQSEGAQWRGARKHHGLQQVAPRVGPGSPLRCGRGDNHCKQRAPARRRTHSNNLVAFPGKRSADRGSIRFQSGIIPDADDARAYSTSAVRAGRANRPPLGGGKAQGVRQRPYQAPTKDERIAGRRLLRT